MQNVFFGWFIDLLISLEEPIYIEIYMFFELSFIHPHTIFRWPFRTRFIHCYSYHHLDGGVRLRVWISIVILFGVLHHLTSFAKSCSLIVDNKQLHMLRTFSNTFSITLIWKTNIVLLNQFYQHQFYKYVQCSYPHQGVARKQCGNWKCCLYL